MYLVQTGLLETGDVRTMSNDASGEINQVDSSVNGITPTMDNLVSVKPTGFSGDDVEPSLDWSSEDIRLIVAPL